MADGRRRALALGEVRRPSRAMRLGRAPGTGFSWPRAQRGVARSAQARQSTKPMPMPPLRNGNLPRCVVGGGSLHFYGMVVDTSINENGNAQWPGGRRSPDRRHHGDAASGPRHQRGCGLRAASPERTRRKAASPPLRRTDCGAAFSPLAPAGGACYPSPVAAHGARRDHTPAREGKT